MKRWIAVGLTLASVIAVAGVVRLVRGGQTLGFSTEYQAILLDNGAVYYAKIERKDDDFSVLSDVYYVQNQIDTATKQTKAVLIRRGNEWHAPDRSMVNNRHIVMIEPVTSKSKLAELMASLTAKNP